MGKRFGLENFANIKTETRFVSLLNVGYKSALNSIFSGTSTTFIAQLFTIILLWIGSYFVIEREITPGELLSFYAIIGYFMNPVASLIGANKQIQNALIAADRLFEIMDLEREENTEKVVLKKEKIEDIEFKNVDFQYETARSHVLKNFNLHVEKGKKASFFVSEGNALDMMTNKVTLICLDGILQSTSNFQLELYERYKAKYEKQ